LQKRWPPHAAPSPKELKMKTIEKICRKCRNEFTASLKEHNRGNAKYCSRKCFDSDRKKKYHSPNVVCAYCDKEFYRNKSKLSSSKSGLYFCCREHKDISQRIGGIQEIQPGHYKTGNYAYRGIAKRNSINSCKECGFCKVVEVLEVHHIDFNRSNNDPTNLEILCPTCHQIKHYITGTGRYHS
jgi:hypothetical protein